MTKSFNHVELSRLSRSESVSRQTQLYYGSIYGHELPADVRASDLLLRVLIVSAVLCLLLLTILLATRNGSRDVIAQDFIMSAGSFLLELLAIFFFCCGPSNRLLEFASLVKKTATTACVESSALVAMNATQMRAAAWKVLLSRAKDVASYEDEHGPGNRDWEWCGGLENLRQKLKQDFLVFKHFGMVSEDDYAQLYKEAEQLVRSKA